MSLRNFFSFNKKSKEEVEDKKEPVKSNQDDNDSKAQFIIASSGAVESCGIGPFFPTAGKEETQSAPAKQTPARKAGMTQEEAEEIVRSNTLNPFM